MDKQIIALLIPIMALAIPVGAIIMGGLTKVARLRLEEAKLRQQGGGSGAADEVQELRGEVETLRRELGELNERVDFAERLLARGRDAGTQQERRP
jgi:hypothetical protein